MASAQQTRRPCIGTDPDGYQTDSGGFGDARFESDCGNHWPQYSSILDWMLTPKQGWEPVAMILTMETDTCL